MRIKLEDKEYQIDGIKEKGNTVIAGQYVSHNGVLYDWVEDITKYKSMIDEDGNSYNVEIVPEVIDEMLPDASWLIADIKLWLDAQGISYKGVYGKDNLLGLVV